MFSSRLHWELQRNRIAKLLEAKRRAGTKIFDLTESNPTRAGFEYPSKDIIEALTDPRSLVYDPSPAGLAEARAAVSDYYAASGYGIALERIFLTASTSESYSQLFKMLTDPGDEILVPRPSYPLFEFLAGLESIRVTHYPLAYHGAWSFDMDTLASAVTESTRAIVIVNPNNPTGSFLKKDEFEDLVALCSRGKLPLISDEVFTDYQFAPDSRRVATLANVDQVLTFCLGGLSKSAGLPQMKLGWIVVGGPEALLIQASQRLELIADTYLSVGTPVQYALPRLLAAGEAVRGQILGRVRDNLQFLRSAIGSGSGAQVRDIEGGWYAILQVPRTQSEEEWVLGLLESDEVLVQPGFFYDFDAEAFLILSLLTERDHFQEGVRRILRRLDRA